MMYRFMVYRFTMLIHPVKIIIKVLNCFFRFNKLLFFASEAYLPFWECNELYRCC
jgi:hypothetical protein